MLNFLTKLLNKDNQYYQDLAAKVHLLGESVVVPRNLISKRDFYQDGWNYEIEMLDGFAVISAKPALKKRVPDNVVNINKAIR